MLYVFFFKQKTAYEMRISDWSSDVCSSDLLRRRGHQVRHDVSHKLLNGVARSQTSHSLFGRRIGPGDRSPGPISRLGRRQARGPAGRSEEHTSELQSLMRISYAVFCLKKKKNTSTIAINTNTNNTSTNKNDNNPQTTKTT